MVVSTPLLPLWREINFHYPLSHRQYLFYSFHVASEAPIRPRANEECIIKVCRSARMRSSFDFPVFFSVRSGSQEVCDYKLPSVLQTKPCGAGSVVFQCYYLVYFSVCVCLSLCFSSVEINVINAIIPETSCTLLILAVQMQLNEEAPTRIALIFVNKGQFNHLSSLCQPKMACSQP